MKKILILQLFFLIGSLSQFDPRQHKNWNLLPHDKCGQIHSSRIIGGRIAAMNAYPWIARIGYYNSDYKIVVFLCAGTVANSRTIVTAAHCVANPRLKHKPKMIRLGEHNVQTNPDCEGDFCADPVLDIPISEILLPKIYDPNNYEHDIALMRLNSEIKFTAFIKPICFGDREFLKKDFSGRMAEVAGWGINNIRRMVTSVKLEVVKLRVINYKKCSKYFSGVTQVGPTQICAGGVVGKDSCSGDSGGPLMIVDDESNGPRYYLLGIVSFGPKECGKTDTPGVYTNMSVYLKWFLDNLDGKTNNAVRVE